jgi:hypothetical protein
MRQFNAIVEEAIPAVVSEYLQEGEAALDESWSQDGAIRQHCVVPSSGGESL